jgi:DNA polymerase-3 subunit beta
MKFECKKEELLNALETITPAINSKGATPILSNVLIDAQKTKLIFTATSLDITLTTVLNIPVNETGILLIPAQKLIAIIKEFSTEDVINITSKEDKAITIKCGNSVFKISCMPKDEYPKLPTIKENNSVTIIQQILKSLLSKISFAMLTDTSRPILCGILFKLTKDTLTMVATDAKRIAIVKTKIKNEEEKSFILPMKSVGILAKMLDKDEVTINIEKSRVSFNGKNTQFISNLIDGTFPDYEKATPKESQNKLIIKREDLISALKKAALFTSPDSVGVKLNISTDKLIVSKQTEIDDAQIKLNCKFVKDLTIGFNPNYLLDVLTSVESELVEIELESNDKPALLRKKDEYVYIMLPTKI